MARRRHLRRVADQSEARDVGARVHAVDWRDRFGRGLVQRAHRRHRVIDDAVWRAAELDRGADDAGAKRLGQDQPIARLRAGVREDACRIDSAGDRVAELDLVIVDRVSAEQRDAGFAQLVETAAKDRGDGFGVETIFGKAAMASAVSGRPPIA